MIFKSLIHKLSSYRQRTRLRIKEDQKLLVKLSNTSVVRLNKNKIKEIDNLWGKRIKKYNINYKWFELYHSVWPDLDINGFLPDSFYYAYVDNILNDHLKASILDDKNLYDLYFPDILMPQTLFRKVNGIYLNDKYQIILESEVYEICRSHENIVLKPSIGSVGGYGILFWQSAKDSIEVLSNYLLTTNDIICQSVIDQHDELSKLHVNSINSLRILSALVDDKIEIVSSIVRIGVNNSNVDNTSSGGISCGVNCLGQLNSFAYDIKGKKYLVHPQGAKFEDTTIPNYNKCIEFVKMLAPRFAGTSRFISWDIAINQNAEPVLIEVNLSGGGINFHQMNNGAVFSKYINLFLEITDNYYVKD